MSKLNQWLTLVANLSVVAGIIFLAAEMRLNTQAIQAQTRDSMTDKQMTWFLEGIGGGPELAQIWSTGNYETRAAFGGRGEPEAVVYMALVSSNLREWENSYYQYERGLFTPEEFEARRGLWVRNLGTFQGFREIWAAESGYYAPSFRAEIDRIVAEVVQAQ